MRGVDAWLVSRQKYRRAEMKALKHAAAYASSLYRNELAPEIAAVSRAVYLKYHLYRQLLISVEGYIEAK